MGPLACGSSAVRQPATGPQEARPSGLDLDLRGRVYTDGMDTLRLRVDGMHCGGCAKTLASAVRVLPGVLSVEAEAASGDTTVVYDPERVGAEQIEGQIRAAGFEVAS